MLNFIHAHLSIPTYIIIFVTTTFLIHILPSTAAYSSIIHRLYFSSIITTMLTSICPSINKRVPLSLHRLPYSRMSRPIVGYEWRDERDERWRRWEGINKLSPTKSGCIWYQPSIPFRFTLYYARLSSPLIPLHDWVFKRHADSSHKYLTRFTSSKVLRPMGCLPFAVESSLPHHLWGWVG